MILKEKKCFESDRILPDVIKQVNTILNGDLMSKKKYKYSFEGQNTFGYQVIYI